MNVTAVEAELAEAMSVKTNTSEALNKAVAAKIAAEKRLNTVLVSHRTDI